MCNEEVTGVADRVNKHTCGRHAQTVGVCRMTRLHAVKYNVEDVDRAIKTET
jgi:hypothetical protein